MILRDINPFPRSGTAFNLSVVKDGHGGGSIEFECKKSRGDEAIDFASQVDWPTLKIFANRNVEFMKDQMKKKVEDEKAKTDDDLKL